MACSEPTVAQGSTCRHRRLGSAFSSALRERGGFKHTPRNLYRVYPKSRVWPALNQLWPNSHVTPIVNLPRTPVLIKLGPTLIAFKEDGVWAAGINLGPTHYEACSISYQPWSNFW